MTKLIMKAEKSGDPVTFKKSGENRLSRVHKMASANEAIGKIEKGSDTFILTFGQFSLIDAMVEILDQTGPADVIISTWTAADAHLERTADLMAEASIRTLRLLVDRSFEGRKPEFCYHMRKLFGTDSIRAIPTHAKFMVVRSDTHDIVVRTSMNLNENPRLENLEISEGFAFAEFFQTLTDELFKETDEGVNEWRMATLAGMPEDYPFKEIDAGRILRGSLNGVETTHTVKKL